MEADFDSSIDRFAAALSPHEHEFRTLKAALHAEKAQSAKGTKAEGRVRESLMKDDLKWNMREILTDGSAEQAVTAIT